MAQGRHPQDLKAYTWVARKGVQLATMLDKVAGFQDSRSMAKKRAARVANPGGTLASRRPEENRAKSPNPASQAIQFGDSIRSEERRVGKECVP